MYSPLVGLAGSTLIGPFRTKPKLLGALFRKSSATVPGKTSGNIPKPPRTTVRLSVPQRDHEKPNRGLIAIAWKPVNATCSPLAISEEYAVVGRGFSWLKSP